MCNLSLLNKNELGCITNCSRCDDVQLGFGMVLYHFQRDEFLRFASRINTLFDAHYSDLLLNGNKVYLSTESRKMLLAFNTDELEALSTLLNEAVLLLETRKILNTAI